MTLAAIDTGSPTGRLLFHMLAAIGEFERDLIKERATEGIARPNAAAIMHSAPPAEGGAELDRTPSRAVPSLTLA